MFLFVWLIGGVVLIPNSFKVLDIASIRYLGQISYGIYMYHMIALYAVSFFFKKTTFLVDSVWFHPMYLLLSGGITIIIAHFSYKYYEMWFLKKKESLF